MLARAPREVKPKALVAPNVPLRIALDADEKGATDFLSAIALASRP